MTGSKNCAQRILAYLMANAGKKFEAEVGQSLRAHAKEIPLYNHSSNSATPVCDQIAWVGGTSIVFEAKETHDIRFSFSAITPNERKCMAGVTAAGCRAWIMIKLIQGTMTPRVFATTWNDWRFWEFFAGFNPDADRQKRGCGSFVLLPDEDRPPHFIELDRVQRRDRDGNALGLHWDLSVILGGGK